MRPLLTTMMLMMMILTEQRETSESERMLAEVGSVYGAKQADDLRAIQESCEFCSIQASATKSLSSLCSGFLPGRSSRASKPIIHLLASSTRRSSLRNSLPLLRAASGYLLLSVEVNFLFIYLSLARSLLDNSRRT